MSQRQLRSHTKRKSLGEGSDPAIGRMQLLDPGISVSQASSHKKRATVRKQVVVHKRPRSEAGNLDLPAEIFAMIVSYLESKDVLALFRLNKYFRNLFIHRSSESLWKIAAGNVDGLPPCPPDLSEPQYASLIFSKTCSRCGEKSTRLMDPYLYVRFCYPCRQECVMDSWKINPNIYELVYRSGLKFQRPRGIFQYVSLREDVRIVEEEWANLSRDGQNLMERWRALSKSRLDMRDQRIDHAIKLHGYLLTLDAEESRKRKRRGSKSAESDDED